MTMAAKTIADKLQIKPNTTVWLSHPEHRSLIEPLPAGVQLVDNLADAMVGLMFVDSAAATRATCDAHRDELTKPSILWIAYPKGNKADINRDSLWKIVADYGMRPNSQIAIDDTWSALRFRPQGPGEAPFTGGR
jgi:hypothetical protein